MAIRNWKPAKKTYSIIVCFGAHCTLFSFTLCSAIHCISSALMMMILWSSCLVLLYYCVLNSQSAQSRIQRMQHSLSVHSRGAQREWMLFSGQSGTQWLAMQILLDLDPNPIYLCSVTCSCLCFMQRLFFGLYWCEKNFFKKNNICTLVVHNIGCLCKKLKQLFLTRTWGPAL